MNRQERARELYEWLADLAHSVKLREGVEGVSRSLWTLYRHEGISTHDWAWHVQIPVPVLAAMRRELEKRDIIKKGNRIFLTGAGKDWLSRLFGRPQDMQVECHACQGRGSVLPSQALAIVEEFADLCDQRPAPDVTLDQSHATPETGVLRAIYLLNKGLLGKRLFFMGDDDLVSVACYLVRRHVYPNPEELGAIVIADVDAEYLNLASEFSDGFIEGRLYDAREPLPAELHGEFGVTVTDPPYTLNGVSAFAHRCAQAASAQGVMLLSMPMPDANSLSQIQRNLLEMGWVLRGVEPHFNEYEGASIHAHTSTLLYFEKSSFSSPEIEGNLRYTDFYTGERRPPSGVYECTACGTLYDVGPEKEYTTVHELKSSGCHECENDRFRRVPPRRDKSVEGSSNA